jgi:hypothetical protein
MADENTKEYVDGKDSEVGIVQISNPEEAIEAVVNIMVKCDFNHKMIAETIKRTVSHTIRTENRARAISLITEELGGRSRHADTSKEPLKRLISLLKRVG